MPYACTPDAPWVNSFSFTNDTLYLIGTPFCGCQPKGWHGVSPPRRSIGTAQHVTEYPPFAALEEVRPVACQAAVASRELSPGLGAEGGLLGPVQPARLPFPCVGCCGCTLWGWQGSGDGVVGHCGCGLMFHLHTVAPVLNHTSFGDEALSLESSLRTVHTFKRDPSGSTRYGLTRNGDGIFISGAA